MEVFFNNQPTEILEDATLQQAINAWIGEKQKGIAAAINAQVIPKLQWANHRLRSNDQVLVIRATQGG
jgi:sulfur carrier protein